MDVIELRKRFLTEFVTHRFHYHDEDAKRVRESDFWVKRFISHKNQGANSAYYHMKDTFKWKKSFGIHDFNPLDIPREVYQLSPIFSYLPDSNGVIPIYIRCKMIVKIDVFEDKMKQYFAFIMDQVDDRVRRPRGWSLIFDCTEAGIENANFDLMFFAMDTIGKHFPLQPAYVIAFGIPWMMKPFIKLGLQMIPEEAMMLLKFIDDPEEMRTIFPIENLPDFMEGTASKDYKNVPEKAEPAVTVAKRLFKMSENEVRQLMEPLNYLLNSINNNSLSNDHQHGDHHQQENGCMASRNLSTLMQEFD